MSEELNFEGGANLTGSLLIAHPNLVDPNFRKTVVLISADSEDEGTLGVIINRPLERTLGEHNADFAFGCLKDVPLFEGGPVGQDQMILAAWHWSENEGTFRLYFGITQEKAQDMIIEQPEVQIRGFLGYSGWGKGQLAAEREQQAWLVTPVDGSKMDASDYGVWHQMVIKASPELKFLADMPDDPSLN